MMTRRSALLRCLGTVLAVAACPARRAVGALMASRPVPSQTMYVGWRIPPTAAKVRPYANYKGGWMTLERARELARLNGADIYAYHADGSVTVEPAQ